MKHKAPNQTLAEGQPKHSERPLLEDEQATRRVVASQTIDTLRLHLPELLEPHPVLLAYAYGSIAAGYPTPFSDVDIALVLEPQCELDPYQRFMMELEIQAELEQRCGIRNADVRSINDAPLRVQGRVVTEGLLLYSKDETFRVTFEARTRKRYFDFQPVLRMMREAYFAQLGSEPGSRERTMVQRATIEGIFRNLDAYVNQLRQLATVPREELVDDPVKLGAAKYYLQVAIECCIDAANHIIARQGFRVPESYADSFAVLAESGVIEQGFAVTAYKMVGMGNRLVHLYWEVDADIVFEVLQNNLDDFERFKRYVYNFMRSLERSEREEEAGG